MSDEKAFWPGWETVRLIGRGSFGAVYEIQRKVFDDVEKAALKVISIPQNDSDLDEMYSDGYDSESITATFQAHLKSIVAEYSLMRKMNGSANIVNCDDVRYVQHDDGIGWDIFIKMELLTPLTKALPNEVPEEVVIRIARDMCAALELCKRHEIVHRDIKPQNIFVSPNGDYKLGDFGIAKTVEKTMGGTKIGTYKYMAPEVYNNQPYGSSADIYSLGLVLYWMLNERRMPFMPLPPEKLRAGADEDARQRRLSGEQLPAPAHGSDELKRIVLKACAYDPKDRYASAAAMLDDLNNAVSGTGHAVVPPPKVDKEDDKTVGSTFGNSQNNPAINKDVEDGTMGTVGPVFAPKRNIEEPNEEPKKFDPQTATNLSEPKQKTNILKYILLAVGMVVAIVVILLLIHSCGPNDGRFEDERQRPSTSQQPTGDDVPEGNDFSEGEQQNPSTTQQPTVDDVPKPPNFFSHLTKNGSAGFTGNSSIDVQYYNGYYYYVPVPNENQIARASNPEDAPEILHTSNVGNTHVTNLCVIDDYIFFMEGYRSISAIDIRTNEYKQILTVDGNKKSFDTVCYYSNGWIYTTLSENEQGQYKDKTVRFEPENPDVIETLFEGYVTGVDIKNSRIFYNCLDQNSGDHYSYIYHMGTGESDKLDTNLRWYDPMVVYDGVAYAHAYHKSNGWGLYSIDATGAITKIPCAVEQHTVVDGKLYFRKNNKGFFVYDLTAKTERELSVDTLPINFVMNDYLAIVPVSDQIIAFLGDDGIEDSYGNSGIYLYNIQTGEQCKLG